MGAAAATCRWTEHAQIHFIDPRARHPFPQSGGCERHPPDVGGGSASDGRADPAIGCRAGRDTARNAFVYSWFVYEFTTLAELGGYTVLELALRRRLDPAALPNTSKSPGLSQLLQAAIEKGYLQRGDFEVPSPSGSGAMACQLDFMPMLRNHVAQGNIHLLPQGAPASLQLCKAVIEKLYPARP